MTIKYAHTNIIADDWEKLATFYQNVFGCVPVPPQRNQKGDWLELGTGVPGAHLYGMHLRLPGFGHNGPTLEIYSYSRMEDKPSPAANRKGFGHIAFLVDDVREIQKTVLSNGGKEIGSLSTTFVAGVGQLEFIYMADPEGNLLEIQHWS